MRTGMVGMALKTDMNVLHYYISNTTTVRNKITSSDASSQTLVGIRFPSPCVSTSTSLMISAIENISHVSNVA